MDKQLYRTLLLLVNNKGTTDSVHAYAEARSLTLRDQLETSKSKQRISIFQGALAELRRIKTLSDEVIEGAK